MYKDFERNLQNTMSIMMLYDNVFINNDCFFEIRTEENKRLLSMAGNHLSSDFGIEMYTPELIPPLNEYLEDDSIGLILHKWPKKQWALLLNDAYRTIITQIRFKCSLVAPFWYQSLTRRLYHLLLATQDMDIIWPMLYISTDDLIEHNKLVLENNLTVNHEIQISGFELAAQLACLQFSIKNLDEFIYLRESKAVIIYGKKFQEFLRTLPNTTLDENFLYQSMAEAIENDEIGKKIKNGFSFTSTVVSLASFLPVLSTIGGVAGLGLDFTSRGFIKIHDKHSWWHLIPEISKILTKKRILSLAKK